MLSSTHSDLALLNSGTLRADRIYPKGGFTLRDLVTLLPMMDPMIVLNAAGKCDFWAFIILTKLMHHSIDYILCCLVCADL